jgi:hypothetical protein
VSNLGAAHDLLLQVLRDEGLDVEPRLEAVGSDEEAERLDFVGSRRCSSTDGIRSVFQSLALSRHDHPRHSGLRNTVCLVNEVCQARRRLRLDATVSTRDIQTVRRSEAGGSSMSNLGLDRIPEANA